MTSGADKPYPGRDLLRPPALGEDRWQWPDPAGDDEIAQWQEAVDAEPDHPDRAAWCAALGWAYRVRAADHQRAADYTAAISWYATLLDEFPAGLDRDVTAVELLELYWERYLLRRDAIGASAAVGDLTDEMVGAAAAVEVGDSDPDTTRYAMMLRALMHLEQYQATERAADLDRAIALLAASVWELPADTPRLGLARAELAVAHRLRAERDGDAIFLDLSIAAGERAAATADPADEEAWHLLRSSQALAYEARWSATGDPRDLTRAIVCGRLNLAAYQPDALDHSAAGHCGGLLVERAALTSSAEDAEAAVELLNIAALSAAGDTEWLRWYDLGRAHHVRWRLKATATDLDDAACCLENAGQSMVPDADILLLIHHQRMLVAFDQWAAADQRRPEAAVDFRATLADGRSVLARTPLAGKRLRAALALLVAYGELGLADWAAEPPDAARVWGLLAVAGEVDDLPDGTRDLLAACRRRLHRTGPDGPDDERRWSRIARAIGDQRGRTRTDLAPLRTEALPTGVPAPGEMERHTPVVDPTPEDD